MNTVFALRACVQVLIEQRRGEWIAVDRLIQLTAAQPERVRNVCAQLVAAGAVHHAVHDGIDHFGMDVEGIPLHQRKEAAL